MNILALLQPIQNSVSKTTLRQMSRIILAMIAMPGRVTMLGLSRWTETGGSYRTVQRFFYTVIPWAQAFWAFFREHLLDDQDTHLLAGDECVVTKAGEKTHGLDYFFSSLMKKAVPGLSFFTLALISTKQRRSYPVGVEQMIRTEAEKAASQAKKQAKKAKQAGPKRKPGRPKGSRNKNKAEVALNPELQRIQKMLQSLLNTIQGTIHLTYLVLDGHFGNHPAFQMVRQCQLHLISKLRHDAALCFPYSGPSPKRGPRPRLGAQVDVRKIQDDYLKDIKVEDGFETRTYQMQLLHQDFPGPLNVVILLRTNLETKAWANVILFSSDLELPYDKLIDYYSLRFQIEHMFRFLKQNLGLNTSRSNDLVSTEQWMWLCALAYWQLLLLREVVEDARPAWHPRFRDGKPMELTPGQVQRAALGHLLKLGTPACAPRTTGKGKGRSKGYHPAPRKIYPVVKMTKPGQKQAAASP